MDIVKKRRLERENLISKITEGLQKVKDNNDSFPYDFKTLLMIIQSKMPITRRTAVEYLNIALFNVGQSKNKLPYKSTNYNIQFEIILDGDIKKWKNVML
jgi:hypothetical protein